MANSAFTLFAIVFMILKKLYQFPCKAAICAFSLLISAIWAILILSYLSYKLLYLHIHFNILINSSSGLAQNIVFAKSGINIKAVLDDKPFVGTKIGG